MSLEAEVIALPPFSREHVGRICESLANRLAQQVLSTAVDRMFDLTQGAPLFVNSLAQRSVELFEQRKGAITAADMDKARDAVLDRRGGLIDEVLDRMRDPRFKSTLEQVMSATLRDVSSEEARAAVDLGIIREGADGTVQFANPIWKLLVARQLPNARSSMLRRTSRRGFVRTDGSIRTNCSTHLSNFGGVMAIRCLPGRRMASCRRSS